MSYDWDDANIPPRREPERIKLWRCAEGHWIDQEAVQPLPGRGEELGHCPYPCMAHCDGPYEATVEAANR